MIVICIFNTHRNYKNMCQTKMSRFVIFKNMKFELFKTTSGAVDSHICYSMSDHLSASNTFRNLPNHPVIYVTYSEINTLARELAFLAMWLTRPTSFRS